MNRIKRAAFTLGAAVLLAGTCASLWADAKVNPYEAIAERNPFGLKDPPPPAPPEDNTPKAPPVPLATVEVTGITSILSSKRVLLEIVPGPGKPMLKPILAEGERVESIEVVSINVEKNEVTIKNAGTITNLTFKIAKSTPTTTPPPQPGLPGMVPKPAVPVPQPTQTSYNNPNNQGSGRYNVMVAGGASSAAPTAGGAHLGGANPYSSGVNPGVPTLSGSTDGGFRSIPSRNPRANYQTPGVLTSPEPVPLNPIRNVALPPLPGQP